MVPSAVAAEGARAAPAIVTANAGRALQARTYFARHTPTIVRARSEPTPTPLVRNRVVQGRNRRKAAQARTYFARHLPDIIGAPQPAPVAAPPVEQVQVTPSRRPLYVRTFFARRLPVITRGTSETTPTPLVKPTLIQDRGPSKTRQQRTYFARRLPQISGRSLWPQPLSYVRPKVYVLDSNRSRQVRGLFTRRNQATISRGRFTWYRPKFFATDNAQRRAHQVRTRPHHRERPIILRARPEPTVAYFRPKVYATKRRQRTDVRYFARHREFPAKFRAPSTPTATPLVRNRVVQGRNRRKAANIRAWLRHREQPEIFLGFRGSDAVVLPTDGRNAAAVAGGAGGSRGAVVSSGAAGTRGTPGTAGSVP